MSEDDDTPPGASTEARATRRKRRTVRGRVLQRTEMAAKSLSEEELFELDTARPRTRLECYLMERPCPYVGCKYHLYLDVNPETGSIKLNFPDKEVDELKETCALDVADAGGAVLDEVGDLFNLTRERIRQVEVRALLKLKMDGEIDGARDLALLDRAEAQKYQEERKELFTLLYRPKKP